MVEKYASGESFASWMLPYAFGGLLYMDFVRVSSIPIRAHNGSNEYRKTSQQGMPPGYVSDPALCKAACLADTYTHTYNTV